MLVTMVGTTMMAIALSSGTAKLIRPIAIGGMPMPIAPLATPATTNATAIKAICVSDIYAASGNSGATRLDRPRRPRRQGVSAEQRLDEAVELGPEAGADVVGLHHDLVPGT